VTADRDGRERLAGRTSDAPRCSLQRLLDGVDDEDRAAILRALHSTKQDGADYVSDDKLVIHLDGAVSNATLSRHRAGLCKCRHGGTKRKAA
jgi:hypothetical protein